MIGRLIRRLGALIALVCVATVVAQAVVAGYLWKQGLDASRLRQASSALQGKLPDAAAAVAAEPPPPAPDVEEIDAARSLKLRDLELREESLRLALDQMTFERGRVAGERGQVETIKRSFETQLAEAGAAAAAASEENVRSLWENMKPKQVKEQILLLLDDDALEQVVARLAAMPIVKRAKIAGEFKTDEEQQKLSEILERMGEGEPETAIIDEAQRQLQPTDAARGEIQ